MSEIINSLHIHTLIRHNHRKPTFGRNSMVIVSLIRAKCTSVIKTRKGRVPPSTRVLTSYLILHRSFRMVQRRHPIHNNL